MRGNQRARFGLRGLGAVLGAGMFLAACAGGSPTAAPPATNTPVATGPTVTANPLATKTLQIAYLSFAVANSYDAPMLAAAQAAAAAGNAKLTVFDANLNPATQVKQLQDAVASGKFDAILVQPLYGAGMLEDVKAAIAAGIYIGNVDQTMGADFTTAASQVAGLSSNVAFVANDLGRKIGELVVTACATTNPCNVGYIWSVKAAALDGALKVAFDKAIAVNPNIKIVSDDGESFYTTALGLTASQNIIAAHGDVTVIVSADQAITGAVEAVKAAGLQAQVKLVGYGGGTIAFQGIKSGERFGTVMQMPATEGRLGVEQLIKAIRTGAPQPGFDPLSTLQDGGVVTIGNADAFLTLGEWPG